jgi:hypothetical protein
MQNNLNKILPLLRFDLGTYHVQVLQRSKDGHDKATRLVAEWYVSSKAQLEFLMEGIIALCHTYNARAYINVNPKANVALLWKLAKSALDRIETNSENAISLLSHSHDSLQGNGVRYWIVDVDDTNIDLYQLQQNIEKCESGFDANIVATVNSKSGIHFITVPFNQTQLILPAGVEIKKNASTILYCL